ncbi:MAG TPA: Trm112 family protein [Xanthomonadales bacterium]|nr:Trm112 family protein [Xanthomonadales bacterium]
MAIDRRLLEILCCPVSRRPLRPLRSDQLQWLNDAIASAAVRDVNGSVLSSPFVGGLITDDGKVIYRIDDDIPVLLPEEGVGTTQLDGFPG